MAERDDKVECNNSYKGIFLEGCMDEEMVIPITPVSFPDIYRSVPDIHENYVSWVWPVRVDKTRESYTPKSSEESGDRR